MTTTGVDSLLASLDWAQLEGRIRSQQRNREVHTPAISMFRWWARRSHALIGELLENAHTDQSDFCVADPFSGGGTVAIEAARRGIDVYAQDLHPWAVAGLRATLEPVDVEELTTAAKKLLDQLAPLRSELYATTCPTHPGRSEVLTAFWARVATCPQCARDVHLFPYSLLTRASRSRGEPFAWWGCAACGRASRSEHDGGDHACPHCHTPFAAEDVPLTPSRRASCPHEGCRTSFGAFDTTPRWQMTLVQRRCRDDSGQHVHFDSPTESEIRQANAKTSAAKVPGALLERIPAGLETRVLHRAGLSRWADLYTGRQLRVVAHAAPAIDAIRASAAVKARLRLALCGCAEMAGHLSRWDRYYPKAFEAMSNHRYAVMGLSAETNLLADRGRGTLPRRLGHSVNAARWAQQELPEDLRVRRLRAQSQRRGKAGGVVVVEGSSERQQAPSGSVDLVLTDPPYFDDVQYGELAGVLLAWARATGLLPSSTQLDLRSEAVANVARGTGVERYCELLSAIMDETRRTLAPQGRMILTYHNTDLRGWWALGRALRSAGFIISALAVTHAENERDHAKRGTLAFSSDLVIECVAMRPGAPSTEPHLASDSESSEAIELIAAGRVIASMPEGESQGSFSARYRALRGAVTPVRIARRDRESESDCA
ncbi:MAG: DNA adenine methylase [Solirubrobacteraceae bacterium]